ncbi:MAG: hypothetical protein IK150_03020 [Lachnospiraceae bacterium]|nr:hypothetical protein [Lachnospiraceae bacterium]MBR5339033.1 hypothetical protein [Lachnospiraceae bacterium]MBR6978153.1 hypothetical protein [Lachnospiraceae bacterium]
MLETLGKIFTFLGEREKNYKIKKAERELKRERQENGSNPAVLVPVIAGGVLLLAGGAFVAYKILQAKRDQALSEEEADADNPESDFLEDENA